MSEKITIKLNKSILDGDKDVTEITLRPITTKDIIECGYPVSTISNPDEPNSYESRVNHTSVVKYIVRLAQIARPSVLSMDPADYGAATAAVNDLFMKATAPAQKNALSN